MKEILLTIQGKVKDLAALIEAELLKLNPPIPPIVPPPVPPETILYKVVAGDTLSKIGAKYGLDYLIIAAANNIKPPYYLEPGQILMIPQKVTAPPVVTPPAVNAGTDKFGIKKLYASIEGGINWESKFNGIHDPWFDTNHGDATYVPFNGELTISGEYPRMYVHDPAKIRQFRDVECTVYGMRIADSNVDWGGLVICTRANHGTTGNENIDKCDTRSLNSRVRYDGKCDIEKETNHPTSAIINTKTIWAGGMPKLTWIGHKAVCRDLPNGNVLIETYLDLTNGLNGGDWKLINSFEDDGTVLGKGKATCKVGIDPAMKLTGAPTRAGSESGKPNITCYFRSDGVGLNGLKLKWMSVREIIS